MNRLISLITALTLTVTFCAMSLYAYSYKTALGEFGQSTFQRFADHYAPNQLSARILALSNFFIARPRAYLRQGGAPSHSPASLQASSHILAADQAEPIIIDRVPITARIQVVYMPDRIRMSFATEALNGEQMTKIAMAGLINDS